MKKFFAILLAVALTVSAGCSNTGTAGSGASAPPAGETASGNAPASTVPDAAVSGTAEESGGAAAEDLYHLDGTMPMVKDPENAPTMSMLFVTGPQIVVEPNEMIQVQHLNEQTGLVFDWQKVPQEGSVEKINLMIASRDLPDVFWNGITEAIVVQYMDQDIFLPTEELTDKYMPRLSAIYEEAPEYKGLATTPNGHRYGFPYIEEMYGLILSQGPFMINVDWLEKVGKEIPTTVDEWVDCLRAFKAAGDLNGNGEADEYPFAFGLGTNSGWGSYDAFNILTGCFGQASPQHRDFVEDNMVLKDGKIYFAAMDDAFKETAKLFNMLQTEGLVDPDSYSPHPSGLGSALYLDKMKSDVAVYGSMPTWAPLNELPVKSVYDQYDGMPRLSGPGGKMGFRNNATEMHAAAGCTITTECPYPEAVSAWVDYLFEPEVAATTNHGPIDYNYIKTPEGRLEFNMNPDGSFKLMDGYETYSDQRSNLTPVRGSTAILDRYYDEFLGYNWDAVDIYEFQKRLGKEELMAEFEDTWVPHLMMDIEEQNTLSQIRPQLKNIISSYQVQWILDGGVDETWEQYKSELLAAGAEQYVATLQQAYDRYAATISE